MPSTLHPLVGNPSGSASSNASLTDGSFPVCDRSRLHIVLSRFVREPSTSCVLLEGAAGTGKTTLVHLASAASDLELITVSPCAFTEQEPTKLARAFSNAQTNAPCVLFIDDIDHWIPPTLHPSRLHILADICERLQSQREMAPICIVATARSAKDVHPVIDSALSPYELVHIRPLDESDRLRILREALPDASSLDALVKRTPGYVVADMAKLLLEGKRIAQREGLKRSSVHVMTALPLVRPLLLGGAANDAQFVHANQPARLYGLEGAERKIRALLSCSFGSDIGPARAALRAVGLPRGAVVHGVSGSGKSTLLELAAVEAASFGAHVLRVDAVDVLSSVIGAAERAITRLFGALRASAPAVLIVENVQLLAARRGDGVDGAARALERVLATLLVELDGVGKHDGAVLVLASAPDLGQVDAAMLRPGRLEVHVETGLPDLSARRLILEHALRNMLPERAVEPVLARRDVIEELVMATEGCAAAHINALVQEVVFGIVRDAKVSPNEEEWLGTLTPDTIVRWLETRVQRELKSRVLSLRRCATERQVTKRK